MNYLIQNSCLTDEETEVVKCLPPNKTMLETAPESSSLEPGPVPFSLFFAPLENQNDLWLCNFHNHKLKQAMCNF